MISWSCDILAWPQLPRSPASPLCWLCLVDTSSADITLRRRERENTGLWLDELYNTGLSLTKMLRGRAREVRHNFFSILWYKHSQLKLGKKLFWSRVVVTKQRRWRIIQHFLQAFTALLLDTAHTISVIDITQSHKQVWQLAAEYTVTVSEFLLFLCTNLFKLIERGCVIYKYMSSNLG